MSDPFSGDVILHLYARNSEAKIAIQLSENFGRRIGTTNCSGSSVLELGFSIQPKDIQNGFVFGNDKSCDIFLKGGGKGRHFAITFNSSTGILLVKSLSHVETTVGPRILLKRGDSRVLEQDAVISSGGCSFLAKAPDRGIYQEIYEQKLAKYLGYLLNGAPGTVSNFQSAPIQTRRRLGPLLQFESLDRGGFSSVGLFTHHETGDVFAVKAFRHPGDLAAISREIKTLQAMTHRNIVSPIGNLIDNGSLCLITEYLPSGNLTQHKDLEMTIIVEVLSQCLEGLSYLHSHRVLHRDIKPENIILQSQFPVLVKIVDFGMAGVSPQRGTACGTKIYTAPEIWYSKPYNNTSDIWSLGLTGLELLKGFPEKEAHMFLDNQIYLPNFLDAIHRVRGFLPPELSKFLGGMLQIIPRHRWSANRCLKEIKEVQRAIRMLKDRYQESIELNRVAPSSPNQVSHCLKGRRTRLGSVHAGTLQQPLAPAARSSASTAFDGRRHIFCSLSSLIKIILILVQLILIFWSLFCFHILNSL